MPLGNKDVIGNCEKCDTPGSLLHLYDGRWLCSGNFCISEEVERDSDKVVRDQQFLANYRSVVRGVRSD